MQVLYITNQENKIVLTNINRHRTGQKESANERSNLQVDLKKLACS